jgi:hypothetical protein
MFVHLAIVITVADAGVKPQSLSQARASVRVERATISNEQYWKATPHQARKELLKFDEKGNPVLIRLIEHE